MAAFSDDMESKILQSVFNKVAFVEPDTYIALFTDDPTDAGTGTEVTGGSYARELCDENGGVSPTWNTAVVDGIGYLVDNLHDIVFTTATASWGTVTHFAIFDAVSGGNLIMHGALDTSKAVGDGDTFKFLAGNLNLRVE